MNIPIKKLNNCFEIPVLGFGTWLMGGSMEKETNYDENNDLEYVR